MFKSKEIPKYQLMIEGELDRALIRLKTDLFDSEDYKKTLALIERLHDMLETEKPAYVSKDTIVNAATNLLGILLIIKHEHVNVITSKALGFVTRLR
jgi:hypothetical protein